MPTVSVIMPVYNAGVYLKDAVKSVLAQTFEDFELLLIDDGSTDQSAQECDAYAEGDHRVRVIHQKNGGISAARNKGIEEAVGEFVAFIDQDDAYTPSLLKENLELLRAYKTKVVKYCRKKVFIYDNGNQNVIEPGQKELMVLRGEDLARRYEQVREGDYLIYAWAGLYEREFLNLHQIRFRTDIRFGGEDQIFNFQIYRRLEEIVCNPKTYYLYYQREAQSTCRKFSVNRIDAAIAMLEEEKILFEQMKIEKYFPDYWKVVVAKQFTEIPLTLSHPDCPFTAKEKKEWVEKLRNEPVFSLQMKGKDYKKVSSYSRKQAMALFFFYHHMDMMLWKAGDINRAVNRLFKHNK